MPRFSRYDPPFQFYSSYKYRPRTHIPEPLPTIHNSEPLESTPLDRSLPKKTKTESPVWLDLFGIKLYFDDVLILSLLFFLYKEDVKDEGLFLALVLLLIS